MHMFKVLPGSTSTQIRQCQNKVVRSPPPIGGRGRAFIEKTQRQSKDII